MAATHPSEIQCDGRPRSSYARAVESCDGCGFEWDAITATEIPPRLRAGASAMGGVLDAGGSGLSERPEPMTWSTMEYVCHARDVLFNLRDRIINGLAEDNPSPKPMFNDVRMASGIYAREEPQRLALEIVVAAGMLARTVELLDDAQLSRTLVYPWPRSADRSLLWVSAQALHELEHHLDDVRRSVT